jgi:hypothetical protein
LRTPHDSCSGASVSLSVESARGLRFRGSNAWKNQCRQTSRQERERSDSLPVGMAGPARSLNRARRPLARQGLLGAGIHPFGYQGRGMSLACERAKVARRATNWQASTGRFCSGWLRAPVQSRFHISVRFEHPGHSTPSRCPTPPRRRYPAQLHRVGTEQSRNRHIAQFN